MANNPLGTIQIPDDDTLAKLLATVHLPDVISGGGPLGAIAQAKGSLGSGQQTTDPNTALLGSIDTQPNVPMPDQDSLLGSVAAPTQGSVKLTAAENKLQDDTPKPYDWHTPKQEGGHSLLGKIGHVLATAGNIAGDVLDPSAMALIPNTQLHNALRLGQDQQAVQQQTENVDTEKKEQDSVDSAKANRDAEQLRYDQGAPGRQAAIDKDNAETFRTLNPLPKEGEMPLGKTADNFNRTLTDRFQILNPGKPLPQEFSLTPTSTQKDYDRIDKAMSGVEGARATVTQQKQADAMREQGFAIAQQNHRDAIAQHEEAMDVAKQQHGRGILDKAEQTYRVGAQSADELENMVNGAEGGNKAMASAVPLEGALAINTSQGVKRINRTEVDQFEGAGNLFDKISGEIGKLTLGQPIPKNILEDQRQLAALLRQGSYKTYRSTFDSAQTRYGLDDEKPLPAPGGSKNGPQAAPAGSTGIAPGSDGHKYYHDAKGNALGRAD